MTPSRTDYKAAQRARDKDTGYVRKEIRVKSDHWPAVRQAIDTLVERLDREAAERDRIAAMPKAERKYATAEAWSGLIWDARNKAIDRTG